MAGRVDRAAQQVRNALEWHREREGAEHGRGSGHLLGPEGAAPEENVDGDLADDHHRHRRGEGEADDAHEVRPEEPQEATTIARGVGRGQRRERRDGEGDPHEADRDALEVAGVVEGGEAARREPRGDIREEQERDGLNRLAHQLRQRQAPELPHRGPARVPGEANSK